MSTDVRRVTAGTAHTLATEGKIGKDFALTKTPEYWAHRNRLFDSIYEAQVEKGKALPALPIEITLPNGDKKAGTQHKTTPLEIAKEISEGLAKAAIVAKVEYSGKLVTNVVATEEDDEDLTKGCTGDQGVLWDLTRPLEGDCKLSLLKFDDPDAQHVFWHSSAHILGEALECEYGAHLTTGPALSKGFYYDSYIGENVITHGDYQQIESKVDAILKEDQPFVRAVLTKQQALEMFQDNPFKVQIITNKVPDDAMTTVYRCGNLIDLCRGPHIVSTARVKAMSIEKHSSAYWLGKTCNDSLQRVYGVSFPDTKMLKQHKKFLEEAKKRDHRMLGGNLNLFFFDPNASPGSCFWLPDGYKVYNKLCDWLRGEYRARGFEEVLSPNIFSSDVWMTSGHIQNYKENMFLFDVEGKSWGLKPMNCPGHCLMFKHLAASYRQLPVRFAEFGVLHRNELTGSLAGLTRVRRFQQDDAHIFCRLDQVKDEVQAALDFVFFIYEAFGFMCELKLGTKPAKALGDPELWETAESALVQALEESGRDWSYNPGDGAFYGPKIDFRLKDALDRWHQCGTLQLDFNLPKRFNLSFRTEEVAQKKTEREKGQATPHFPHGADDLDKPSVDGSMERELLPGHARPVMIHRAILGGLR
eukprot:GHVN01059217.1.p1 GENE.GHVN01059217.1~~GHVN01059217.1.p1  ORF type:complete len:689 (+),score=56.12 GHVN01059217.1:139-2067(+)